MRRASDAATPTFKSRKSALNRTRAPAYTQLCGFLEDPTGPTPAARGFCDGEGKTQSIQQQNPEEVWRDDILCSPEPILI